MDELDLILASLDSSEVVEVTAPEEDIDPDVATALSEFDSAKNPRDRADALRVLMRLIGK